MAELSEYGMLHVTEVANNVYKLVKAKVYADVDPAGSEKTLELFGYLSSEDKSLVFLKASKSNLKFHVVLNDVVIKKGATDYIIKDGMVGDGTTRSFYEWLQFNGLIE
uniref:Uncharacterized protein n=1 Tax=Panagrolaimus sp. JU765 TaxID=591449 RepID=A0AC34Q3J2_9BILA